MSDLLRVTTPVAPKDYSMNQNVKPQAPEQVFELGNVEYINKANTRDDQLAEQNLKDGGGAALPKLQTAVAKDPAMSSILLKGLISGAALDILRQSGNAELLNKVTEFAGEIMLLPNADEIAADIVRQQTEATVFSDPLWSELKDMLSEFGNSPVGEEFAMAVLDFAKATAAADARESILTSISEGLRYLAGETAQSREIMDLLNQTADRLNAYNFTEVKQDVLSLVNYLQDSLLLSDKTQNLLSLITYNLSRFNNNNTAVAESFRAVVSMTQNPEAAKNLETLFTKFIESSKLPLEVKLAAMDDTNASSAVMAMTMLTERVANAMDSATKDMPPTRLEKLAEDLSKLVEELNALSENTTGAENNVNAENTVTEKASEALGAAEAPEAPEAAAESTENAESTASAAAPSAGGIDIKQGTAFLRKIIAPLVPDNMKGAVNTLLRSFESEKNLNTLIDRLSVIVNRMENLEAKVTVAQSINQVLSQLAAAEGITYKPPTTMENMLDFLVKNINDPSLKSLSAMNRGEMLQGLLTSPGVFSPLLHFLIPMNMDGTRAFGELWADPDAGNGEAGSENDKHLFLCFEIEETGYFELELYARGRSINVSLLCPEGSERKYLPLKETIPVIASVNGYNAEKMIISPLKKKRDLNKVFPKLNERKNSLNVSV